jgi:signal transduction histidine kinase
MAVLKRVLFVDNELIRKLVEFVESGSSIGGDLAAGARLLAETVGYQAVSIYAAPGTADSDKPCFVLQAHALNSSLDSELTQSNGAALSPVNQVNPAKEIGKCAELELLLNERSISPLPSSLADSFFDGAQENALTLSIYPLGSGKSAGFLLLWGAPTVSAFEAEALVEVGSSVLLLAVEQAAMTLRVKSLTREVAEAEARVKGVEKFLYLGDMAAMLVHEIKNPIISIGGFAKRLKKKVEPHSPAFKCVEQMISEVHRIEKITDGAFRCLGDEFVEHEEEDFEELLAETLGLFGEEFTELGIEQVLTMKSGPVTVLADREQLKIAFDNLIANAIQSMDKGGKLTLCVTKEAGHAVVDITDTGGGIDSEKVDSIFIPFFTTKEYGTGLGLPISNTIIMHHQGSIEVIGSSEEGTTFRVRLPRVSEE